MFRRHDVIIGGHEHTLLESSSGGAPIFKMTADARELGQIDLNISKSTGAVESIDWKVIPVTDKTKDDPAVCARSTATWRAAEKAGDGCQQRSSVDLMRGKRSGCGQETNVGRLHRGSRFCGGDRR